MKKLNFTAGLTLSIFVILFSLTNCTKSDCREQIKEDCFCNMHYTPVCGCNDKTYGNSCVAECSGISNFTDGECD